MTALPDHARRRFGRLGAAGAGLALAALAVLAHAAGARRGWERRAPERRAAVRVVGHGDLALSSTSRWLRHPSLAEPGAPFADGPAVLDQDPAGGILAPPRQHFGRIVGGAGTVIRVRPAGDGPPAAGPGKQHEPGPR